LEDGGEMIQKTVSRDFFQTIGDGFRWLFARFYDLLTNTLDRFFFNPLQKLVGMHRMPYAFVLPNLLVFGLFSLLPMLLNFGYAFTKDPNLFLSDRPYVGMQNFQQIFDCKSILDPNSCVVDLFWRAVWNTAQFVVFQVVLMVAISLLTALILNRKIKARGFFRSVYFYPVLLSPIVVALLWKWILQDSGLLNGILVSFGIHSMPFMTDPKWARFWMVMISTWSNMGFYTLILLAGLQAIPTEMYEAASMDGADGLHLFLKIILPLLMPTMLVVTVLSLIRAVQIFDIVYAFTGGGPGSATMYLVQYIYMNGFSSPIKLMGLASTASILMATVLVILTVIQLVLRKNEA
jgi:alpha-1,4-digalacturonate transport system permease protein